MREPHSRIPSIIIGTMGAILLTVIAVINWKFGHSLGESDDGKLIYAAAVLAVDILGAVLATFVVASFRLGKRKAGYALSAILGGCLILSTLSVVGFGANERIAKAQSMEDAQAAQRVAAQEANTTAMQFRAKTLEWLQRSTLSAGNNERKQLLGEVKSLTLAPVEIKPVPVVSGNSDAQAKVLANLFGLSRETMQTALIALLAIILKSGEIACFALASARWPRKVAATVAAIPTSLPNIPTAPPDGGGGNKEFPKETPGKFPAIPRQKAITDYLHLTANGQREIPPKKLAERWRCSPGEVSKRIKMAKAKAAAARADRTVVVPMRRAA